MEGVGLAVGVVPLIVLSFDTYRRIVDLRDQYRRFDKDLDRCLRNIYGDYCIFKTAIDVLLKLCGETDAVSRADMMANLQSDRWRQESLSSRMDSALGVASPAVFNAIDGVSDTIVEVEAKLLALSRLMTSSTIDTTTEEVSSSGMEPKGYY